MHAWTKEKITTLFFTPFFELINQAYTVHQKHFDMREMEFCTLLSIKTGSCPEDCAYCPQSAHYNTELKKEKLMNIDAVLTEAKKAKASGAKRFCMGAAWRNPPKKDFPIVLNMIREVKKLGLETCVTLGMLDVEQAAQLKEAGLDFYNHNLDTSPEFYGEIITTRTYQDRLDTLQCVEDSGINVCCGGILGMGESREDRVNMLIALQSLRTPPKSIPINKLIRIKGTPLENVNSIDTFEFIRMIAVTRIVFPASRIRLSAGREEMTDEAQAWCFMAGANSIFVGDRLLTAKNPSENHDIRLMQTLNMNTPQCAPLPID